MVVAEDPSKLHIARLLVGERFITLVANQTTPMDEDIWLDHQCYIVLDHGMAVDTDRFIYMEMNRLYLQRRASLTKSLLHVFLFSKNPKTKIQIYFEKAVINILKSDWSVNQPMRFLLGN